MYPVFILSYFATIATLFVATLYATFSGMTPFIWIVLLYVYHVLDVKYVASALNKPQKINRKIVDNMIDKWYGDDECEGVPLQEYFGLSDTEYGQWMRGLDDKL